MIRLVADRNAGALGHVRFIKAAVWRNSVVGSCRGIQLRQVKHVLCDDFPNAANKVSVKGELSAGESLL